MRALTHLLTVIGLASTTSSAFAASFLASGGVGGNFRGACIVGSSAGSTAQTFNGSCSGDAIGRSEGRAGADFGHVGVRAYVESYSESNSPASWESRASFSDTLIFTSTDPEVTTVVVSANFILEGIMQGFSSRTAGYLEGRVDLGSSGFVFSINPSGSTPVSLGGLAVITGDVSGIYGQPTDALLRTPLVAVRVGTPIGFGIGLSGGGFSVGTGRTGLVDFGNSFEVPISSDAFVLPEGVTVNSGNWLVNNRRVPANVVGVPEPATWAMLVGGFGLIGGVIRRRRSIGRPGLRVRTNLPRC